VAVNCVVPPQVGLQSAAPLVQASEALKVVKQIGWCRH
jgi:hypothetical protein